MAIVTRSLGVLPYQGGTLLNNPTQTAMCRLSATRMVWFYYQTSPNWLIGAVVDTPGGLAAGGTPVLTNQQLLTQRGASVGPLHAVKINATTVAVVSPTYTGYLVYNVYEIDPQTGSMLEVDKGAYSARNSPNKSPSVANYLLDTKLIHHSDNLIQYVAAAMSANSQIIQSVKGTWNGVTKKLVWDAQTTDVASYGTLSNGAWVELIVKKIPGRQMTLLSIRQTGSTTVPLTNSGSRNVVFDDNDGSIYMTSAQMPGGFTTNNNLHSDSELIPLPGDRAVMLNGNNGATFYNIEYDTKSYLRTAYGQFASDNGTTGGALLPLSADYFATISRPGIMVPAAGTPISVKVIRRYDNNFVEQSPASSMNSNRGFRITGVPTTRPSIASYPEMVEGKIFWWGLDSTGNKLSWTLAGLEQNA